MMYIQGLTNSALRKMYSCKNCYKKLGHKNKILLPLGPMLYNMVIEDCDKSSYPNLEVHVSKYLPLDIEEDNKQDFWKETLLDNKSEELINTMVSSFAKNTTKPLINWIQIFKI